MIRLTVTLLLSLGLSGCQGARYPLPSCDGYSRRPLNRSMWDWDKYNKPSPGPAVRPVSAAQAIDQVAPRLTREANNGATDHG